MRRKREREGSGRFQVEGSSTEGRREEPGWALGRMCKLAGGGGVEHCANHAMTGVLVLSPFKWRIGVGRERAEAE